MFGILTKLRPYKLSLNHVYDNVRITAGSEHLDLRVDADAMRLVAGLNESQKRLRGVTDDSSDESKRDAALYFAGCIFGKEQAAQIMELYHGDAGCVINICGRYFSDRLAGLIEKAQKRAK